MNYADRDKNLLALLQRNRCLAFGYINNPNRELPPTYLVYDYEDGAFETACCGQVVGSTEMFWSFKIAQHGEMQRMIHLIEDGKVVPLTLAQHGHQLPLDRTHRYFYSVGDLIDQARKLGACAVGIRRASKARSIAELEDHLIDSDWIWLADNGFVQAFDAVQRRIGAGTSSMRSLLSIYVRHPEVFNLKNVLRFNEPLLPVLIAAILVFTDIPVPRSVVKEQLSAGIIDFVYTVRPWRAYWC